MAYASKPTLALRRSEQAHSRPQTALAHRPSPTLGNQAALRRLSATPPRIQPKLEIGSVDDPLEYEADAVAEQVMRMPDPGPELSASPPRISRKCAECEAEEKLQTKRANADMAGEEAPAAVDDTLRSTGQPLDPATRGFFERRFGQDFSAVRIHADARAASSAREINARAYTVGRQIVFGAGHYGADRQDGRLLIAHELAHVVQQGAASGLGSAVQRPLRPNGAGRRVQRDDAPDAGPPAQAAPSVARDLTEDDEKTCSPLYLQKLCVFIDGGFGGDRSGVPDDAKWKSLNAACRDKSGYPATEPDIRLSDAEVTMLRSPKCDIGKDAAKARADAAKAQAHDERSAEIRKRSPKYILGGAGDEFVRMVQDPIFQITAGIAIAGYILLWLFPEPFFTKAAAALTTIAILSASALFTISTILKVAHVWQDLDSDADTAQSDDEIEAAAKRFGEGLGAVGADLLVFVASLLLGGKLPGPKRAPPVGEALAGAERVLATPKPGGELIRVNFGRAFVDPPGGTPPPANFAFDGTSPLKFDFAPAPESAPVPEAPPAAAPAPAPQAPPAPAPSPAPGTPTVPSIPVVPGVAPPKDKKPSAEKVADSNIFMDRVEGGPPQRARIDATYLADPKLTLDVPAAAISEATKVDPNGTQRARLRGVPGGATIVPDVDGNVEPLRPDFPDIFSAKFGENDLRISLRAVERGVPLLTAQAAMATQVKDPNFPKRVAAVGSTVVEVP